MARPSPTQTRLANLLKHWPVDPIRPPSVSVQTYLQSRLSQSPSSSSTPQSKAATTVKSTSTSTNPNTISPASLNALSSLLEDRYARRYPLSPKLRKPASNPDHYDDLIREFEEAPSRDWMGRIWKRLSGVLRLQ
ncbi:hypothetical protein BJY04DRAFT_218198 [Aspergillus karnatakaensis]|uniref:ubiquinol-cytochrome c reductase complex assembly factor 2 n=1 Tax=Aspergillus karnatakaensis TaxID=1810916 RepID=UPI003CCE048A